MCHQNRLVDLLVEGRAFCSLLVSLHTFLPPHAPVSCYWCLWILFLKMLFCYLFKFCSQIILVYLHVLCVQSSAFPPLHCWMNKYMKMNTESCYFCYKANSGNLVCPGIIQEHKCSSLSGCVRFPAVNWGLGFISQVYLLGGLLVPAE